jgi:hypothetical protein
MGQKVGEAPAAHGSSINGFRISVPQQLKENFLINYKKCHPRSARPLGPDLPSHRDEVILKEAIHQRTFFVFPLKKKFRQLAFPPSLLHTPTPFHIHSKKAKIQYCGSGIRCPFDLLLNKFNSLMRIRDVKSRIRNTAKIIRLTVWSNVADPGCLTRISDQNFFLPGSEWNNLIKY